MFAQTFSKLPSVAQPLLLKRFRYVIAGFHSLAFYWVLSAFFPAEGLSVEKVITSFFLLLAVLMFSVQIVLNLESARLFKIYQFSKLFVFLLISWCLVTIARGIEGDIGRLLTLVANPEIGGLVWLLPFALYIGRQPGALLALTPVFRLHAIFGLLFLVWSIVEVGALGVLPKNSPAKVGLVLLYAAPIVLLIGIGNRKDRLFYVLCLLVSIIGNFILSNRAGFAISLVFLIVYFILGKARDKKKIRKRLIISFFMAIPLLYFGMSYVASKLSDDWFVDTRSFLVIELADDFEKKDWIVGRGALGAYFSPYFEYTQRMGLDGDSSVRQVSEIGYLHLILKSGVIGAGLYFVLFVYAVLAARNLADHRLAVGIIILLGMHLSEMVIVGQASMLPYRVVLWILVGVAISKHVTAKALEENKN